MHQHIHGVRLQCLRGVKPQCTCIQTHVSTRSHTQVSTRSQTPNLREESNPLCVRGAKPQCIRGVKPLLAPIARQIMIQVLTLVAISIQSKHMQKITPQDRQLQLKNQEKWSIHFPMPSYDILDNPRVDGVSLTSSSNV